MSTKKLFEMLDERLTNTKQNAEFLKITTVRSILYRNWYIAGCCGLAVIIEKPKTRKNYF